MFILRQEEDIRLHADNVAVLERIVKAIEDNMDNSTLSNRLIACISDTFNRTRRWKSMTLNLYLVPPLIFSHTSYFII